MSKTVSFLFWCLLGCAQCFLQSKRIQIDGNGYTGVTVVISSQLTPSEVQIQKLKDLFTAASAQLYKSTKYHLYFKNITIVIPKSWPNNFTTDFISGPQVETAHVLVEKPNPLVDNKPYVSGMTGCGQPGKHIHLEPITVQVLPAVGLADKILVHHWGHFRWGLFDEHGDKESPVMASTTNPWFYSSEGTFKPNICMKDIKGDNHKGYCQSSQQCVLNDNGLPEPGCKFCVDERANIAKGSIMGKPEISSVLEFCDHGDSDVPHNAEAETPHNKLCRGKSAWEVMRLHPDFKDTTAGTPAQNTAPIFKVVQQRRGQNVVMVLDKSGSMNTYDETKNTNPRQKRIDKLKDISSNYIRNWSPNATSVAVVTFNETADVVAPLTIVTSEEERQNLVALVDNIVAKGATSIGAGIRKAIEILKADNNNIRGNEIILVSDGANTVPPGPNDVREEVLREGVIIRSVAIGSEADKKIDKLAKDSGGFSFFYSGIDQSTALADIFLGIAASSSDKEDKIFQIESKSVNLTKGHNYSTTLTIDSTIGRETTILLIGPGVDFSTVTISGPGNKLFTSGNCSKSCRLKIDGLAEVGDYYIEISTSLDKDVILTMTAQSYPRDPSQEVFTATAWTLTEVFDFSPSTPIVMYSSVQKGTSPVLDADVKMIVEDSDGHVINVDLRDDGQGMDIIPGDGQYAGVVLPTQVKSDGRHSLKLVVTGKEGQTKILIPETSRRKRATQTNAGTLTVATENVSGFKRVASGGTFTVQNYSAVTGDQMAPGRITTLKLINSDGNVFNLSWNAVGDDLNVGTASSYKILLSKNYSTLLNSPNTVTPLTGNIPTPSPTGGLEVFSLRLSEAGVSYFLAIQTVDDVGNVAELSNIVSLSVLSNNQMWKRVEVKEMTSSQSFSYVGLIISACAAALLVFGVILCGICFCKRKRGPKSKTNQFSNLENRLAGRANSRKGDFRHNYFLPMYQSPYVHFPSHKGYQAYGRNPRTYGYMDESRLYYIS